MEKTNGKMSKVGRSFAKAYNSLMASSSINVMKWISLLLNVAEIISLSEAAMDHGWGPMRAYSRFFGVVVIDAMVALAVDSTFSNGIEKKVEKEGHIDWIQYIGILIMPGLLFTLNIMTTGIMYESYLESIDQLVFEQKSGSILTLLFNYEIHYSGELVEEVQSRAKNIQNPSVSVWGPLVTSLAITLMSIFQKTAQFKNKGLIRGIKESTFDFRHFIEGNPFKMIWLSFTNIMSPSNITPIEEVKRKYNNNEETVNKKEKGYSNSTSAAIFGYFPLISGNIDTILKYPAFLAKCTDSTEAQIEKAIASFLGVKRISDPSSLLIASNVDRNNENVHMNIKSGTMTISELLAEVDEKLCKEKKGSFHKAYEAALLFNKAVINCLNSENTEDAATYKAEANNILEGLIVNIRMGLKVLNMYTGKNVIKENPQLKEEAMKAI